MCLARPFVRVALLLAFLCAAFGTLSAQQPQKMDAASIMRAHMMLRQAYTDVKDHYYDPQFRGINLEANFKKSDAGLDVATSNSEAFRIIAAFLYALQDSHTFFIPPSRVSRMDRGFRMEMVGDACFITHVRPGSDAAAKLKVGDRVMLIDGFNITRDSFHDMQYFFETLLPARDLELIVQNPAGERRKENVTATFKSGKNVFDLTNEGDYTKLILDEENDDHLHRQRTFESGDTMIWKMPWFYADSDELNAIFGKAAKHKTLILDLRGNPGGSVETLRTMLSHVFDREVTIASRISRKNQKPETAKPTKGTPFTGKLIVLIDSRSASASELFARVVQIEKRGMVIGDRSAGAVMEARHYQESVGLDDKVFYGFSITSADLVMADGKSLEKVGVTPDTVMLPTATEIAAGEDPVLVKAADLAGLKLEPLAAGKLFPFEWPPL
jgi:carboxyl-terminal processing protease